MNWDQIKLLVQAQVIEQTIQAKLKEDLHLIGRALAPEQISDEYIAFSEFPVGQGAVDFTVFTDRSRMHVYFIEVKGADFHFVNANGSIHANINEGARQVRERITEVSQNYQEWRHRMHVIRTEVEAGSKQYNSTLGNGIPLKVDPLKDVCFYGLVIGGTTRDDIEESRLRHQWELDSKNIRFESWNSWLRKR